MKAKAALVIAAVGALALSAGAHAADMPGWPPPYEKPAPQFTELSSGWYLRGDLGYRYNRLSSIDSAVPVTAQSYDNAMSYGGGFGYKHKFLRADLTLDYTGPARITGTTALPTGQPQYSTKVGTVVALANGYFDFGTWAGFTPYVGAGAGAAYISTYEYNNTTMGAAVPTTAKTNFAWAWTAGVSFTVTPNWAFDIGYRNLHLGDAVSGTEPTGAITRFRGLNAQEIRIGFRLILD